MRRKNEGSILVFSVVVLSLIALFSATCSALVFSNSKYSRYNYENIAIEELCLGSIELVYANILKEIEKSLEENNDFESFNTYLEQDEFINNISNISIEGSNISCSVNREINRFKSEEGIYYYRIISEYKDSGFIKRILAFVKIENPFEKQLENLAAQDEKYIDDITVEEYTDNTNEKYIDNTNEINESEAHSVETEKNQEAQEFSDTEINIEQETVSNNKENIQAEENTIEINPSDLVEVFGYEEK